MKRLFLIGLFLLVGAKAYAREDWTYVPSVNTYVSQAVNLASHTAVASTYMIISTYPVLLHTVLVNTAGVSSKVEVWDASASTQAATAKLIAVLDTTAKGHFPYNVKCSSGLMINNQGGTPADVTVSYREK